MATAPPTGVVVGRPGPRGGGWAWGGFSFDSLMPAVNALLSRYGQAMDIGLGEMARQPERNEIAFQDWLKRRELERREREYAMASSHAEAENARRLQAAAMKTAEEERLRQQTNERVARQAGVDRAASLHTTYGGPTPFNPSGALADFYEYGAGNPQGRGGGGSATAPNDQAEFMRCITSPTSPGCPQDPLRPGA